jgi:hypothetical protein
MNFMIYELLFGENQAHFLKSSFHLEKKMIYFENLQEEKINGKKSLGINALLQPNFRVLKKKNKGIGLSNL